jgi:hypothetical protein
MKFSKTNNLVEDNSLTQIFRFIFKASTYFQRNLLTHKNPLAIYKRTVLQLTITKEYYNMSHPQQQNFISQVKSKYPSKFENQKVLEVGSLNINGSVRSFFTNCEYLGIDVGEGKDVDLVSKGEDYDAPDNTFGVTLSCECFEHNPLWVKTFENMIRMTESGGLVIMTCATVGRAEHGTTRTTPADSPLTLQWDYYKNLVVDDFTEYFDFDALFSEFQFIHEIGNHDLYFFGIKA